MIFMIEVSHINFFKAQKMSSWAMSQESGHIINSSVFWQIYKT